MPRFLALVLMTSVALQAAASGFDPTEFERLDPAELRAAERSVHEYLEPGTARLLREPRTDAEAYVVRRQQRLAAAMQRAPQGRTEADGSVTTQAFWPAARASRATVDEHGRVVVRCVHASAMLGHAPPDFRLGNDPLEIIR